MNPMCDRCMVNSVLVGFQHICPKCLAVVAIVRREEKITPPTQHYINGKPSIGKYVSTIISMGDQTIEVYGGSRADDMTVAQMIYFSLKDFIK